MSGDVEKAERALSDTRFEFTRLLSDQIINLQARLNAHDVVLATLFSLLRQKDEALGNDFIVALHRMTAGHDRQADLAEIARLSHLLVER